MYRQLIPLLLCTCSVLTAPQQNDNITYVKQQGQTEHNQPDMKPFETESRIENVPLTIPGNVDNTDKNPIEIKNKEATSPVREKKSNSQSTYNYSDRIYSIKSQPKRNNTTIENNTLTGGLEIEREHSAVKSKTESTDILPAETDIVPAESEHNDILAGPNLETDATQSNEFVTEPYDEESTLTTEAAEQPTVTPSPTLAPKLSYFEKSTLRSFSQNLIVPSGKRRFRSRCRCEKIWNCAKLQISVPRCPEEYFMCCS